EVGPGSSSAVAFECAGTEPFDVLGLRPGGIGVVRPVHDLGGIRISGRPGALPLAYLAEGVRRVDDDRAAARGIRGPTFDPHVTTLVEAPSGASLPKNPPSPGDRVLLARPEPGRAEMQVTAARDGVVVLTEAYARGWEAEV